jgi:hypothetical protein
VWVGNVSCDHMGSNKRESMEGISKKKKRAKKERENGA